MKSILKSVGYIFVSILILSAIFFSGFFVGKEISVFNAPDNLTNTASADNNADFEPFWKVWNLIDEKFAPSTTTSSSEQEKVWGAISGMVSSLGDPYTEFLPPEENAEFETAITGEFSGVGMEVGIEDEALTVIAPLKDSPAEKAGIKAGDKILAIDGVPSISMKLDEAIKLIRGEAGTTVKITLKRPNLEDPFDVKVVRQIINVPTLKTELRDDGIFVISLYNFSANVTNDFRSALREFVASKKNKLIIDLRGNPGGFLDAAIDIASWFLPAGKVVVKEEFRDGNEKIFRSKGYDIFNDKLKLVILVDRGSASASEILAGALKEHGIATIVGEQTFGKGSVQELIPVTPETSLKVTIARWLTPNGKSISDGGLAPDIVVDDKNTPDDVNLEERQMEEAVRVLGE